MGKIASKYCRKIFVTDDNPRNENPKKIRNTIMKGCKKLASNIGSRKKAIKTAISELGSNEILLVAGKGHEKIQDYGNKIINFSDKKIIKAIIPEISGVIIQLPTIPTTLPHSTASVLTPTAAKPTIAPTIECVVDTGQPK